MNSFIIVGGGLAGCTTAYLLKKKYPKSSIKIFEGKEIGGLCKTFEYENINYELGPHILYSGDESLRNFFEKFLTNKEMKYFQKLSVDGSLDNLYSYPVAVEDVIRINPNAAVELYHLELSEPDMTNVENYLISRVGRTAYEYFFKNYNVKQWGIHPRKMETEWISQRRIFLRDFVDSVFGKKWQGHPGSYNLMFDKMVDGIEVVLEKVKNIDTKTGKVVTDGGEYSADMILNTTPLDMLFERKNTLKYRGISWVYALLDIDCAFPTYLTSFPNNFSFTRIMEYKHQSQQKLTGKTLISFDFPYDSMDESEPMEKIYMKEASDFLESNFPGKTISMFCESRSLVYPVSEQGSINHFWNLLKTNISDKWISFGRLGLYSYISMDTCVQHCMKVVDIIDNWKEMSYNDKVVFYDRLRSKQT